MPDAPPITIPAGTPCLINGAVYRLKNDTQVESYSAAFTPDEDDRPLEVGDDFLSPSFAAMEEMRRVAIAR